MTFFEVYTQWFTEQPLEIKRVASRVFHKEIYISNYTRKVIRITDKGVQKRSLIEFDKPKP